MRQKRENAERADVCPGQGEGTQGGAACGFTVPVLCCMVWSWQPADGLTGSECFFSGSVISTNFL